MTTVTKRYRFAASHRLASGSLSERQNREIFGKCANPFGHGHNYFLEVSVSGEPDAASGLAVNRAALDEWVGRSVLDRMDHTHLNTALPEFQNIVPTAENMLVVIEAWLRNALRQHFPGGSVRLARLRLEETPRNSFRTEATENGSQNG